MSGLVGIVSTHNENNNTEDLLSKMCRAVRHEEWYKTDTYVNKTVGLGRVHLGIFNPEPQPIFNEDKTLCVMMEGEIYDYQDMKEELISKGRNFSVNNDPEFILHLYEDCGKDFVHKLNGSFTLIIWDEKSQELLMINDRYGLRPLYYAERDGYLLLGSEVKAILQDEKFERIVDDRSVADFFSFGYILGTKTFFKGIELLPPASILTCSAGQISIEQYWDFNFNEEYEDQSEEYYIKNLSKLILQAVERQMNGTHRIGVPLSGGFDSRTIVASISKKHYPIHTFTFGKPNCNDAKFAQMVADKLGTDHHFFEFKPDDLASYAEKAVYLTDGMLNCVHAHRMQTYDAAREFMDIALVGWIGDSMIGSGYLTDDLANIEDNFQIFKYLSMYIPINLFRYLFNDNYFSVVEKNLKYSRNYILQIGRDVDFKLPSNRLMYYNLKERQRRFTSMGLILVRNSLEVRTPFSDYDLIDFSLKIPPTFKIKKRLYKKVISTMFPHFEKVPYQATGLPLTTSKFQMKIHFFSRLPRKIINKISKKFFRLEFFGNTKPYADYEGWMKNNKKLREYILSILLDERALARPYFNPNCIKKILDLHMSGKKNYSELIGLLLTFELWNRQFLD
jgi:asparagine synthase (glutamine-hydrolysing)